jgi:hypothetical protein
LPCDLQTTITKWDGQNINLKIYEVEDDKSPYPIGTEFIGKTYNIIDQFGRVVKAGIIASEKHQISIDGIERGAYKFNIDNQWFKKVIIN